MMRRPASRSWLGASTLAGCLLALPAVAHGHPIDQYLQASYITLERGRVTIEVDLTPGLLVREQVLARIDVDRDGEVSEAEEQAYARAVLRDLVLEVDDEARALTVTQESARISAAPGAEGDAIRLEFTAEAPAGDGAHRLFFQNSHEPGMSAYQVNAFLPKDREIAITEQTRDPLRQGIRLGYTLKGAAPAQAAVEPWRQRAWSGLQGLLVVGALVYWARALVGTLRGG